MKLMDAAGIFTASVLAGIVLLPADFVEDSHQLSKVDPPYGSCKEAHADGAYNIKKGDPGYSKKLDRDGDGIACEG
ncbi:excalibur domain-containing protein [Mycobacteroides abscessus subsp. bolletii]|uniref:excalibur calcium-binding domain-containing protein n=1 Tax=Mycobacteroides abscessus TaxID=36809 RepID=UPI0009A65C3B|nr:excalibur calcium-binding domain-containing protein [Mycobacteroides abscessus]SKG68878.1 excalibur domain-containing protein [Mycobacteroides abscessus subsp. bolletii]SLF40337.1 excalibur domain-containing protein [Mycobacteroides abscessus subsp. bolletii]